MPKFDVYEKDGALFRKPAARKILMVDDVYVGGGKWAPYKGDRAKPAHFGEHLGVQEHNDELAVPKPAKKKAYG